jgi:hypothetical protein
MINDHQPSWDQPIAALVWLLGEQRDRSSAPVLIEVLRNSSYSVFAKHRIHFTAVDAAFSALWKINDKTTLWKILELMRESSESGRRKMAALFERLFSTNELLSLDLYGDKYTDADFWSALLEPFRRYGHLDWDRRNVDALFWEIRLLAAIRLPVQEAAPLNKLAADESALSPRWRAAGSGIGFDAKGSLLRSTHHIATRLQLFPGTANSERLNSGIYISRRFFTARSEQ